MIATTPEGTVVHGLDGFMNLGARADETVSVDLCNCVKTTHSNNWSQISYMDELDLVFNRQLMDLGINVFVAVALICAAYVSRDLYRS